MPMVAVRTQGLAFDSIIAYEDQSGNLNPIVPEQYIRTMLEVANLRFATNTERKERFRRALLRVDAETKDSKINFWEPADVRRARKRAEISDVRILIDRG